MFDFFQPVGLDGVADSLHRCLEVSNFDLVLVLLVESLERVLGRCSNTAANVNEKKRSERHANTAHWL